MPKTTEIVVEATKSWNYQTYKVGYRVTLEPGDDPDEIRRVLQARCRKEVMEQIALDKGKA